jgi:hypothetical protein
MNEAVGRVVATGNVAEVFEWGFRLVKLSAGDGSRLHSAERRSMRL